MLSRLRRLLGELSGCSSGGCGGLVEELVELGGWLGVVARFLSDVVGSGELVSSSWNPVTGCLHDCTYCWARRLALTRLRGSPRYRGGFRPRLNTGEFGRRFREGEVVFVCDMGDLWGDWVPEGWIRRVLRHISRFPRTWFLFLTKNPRRYHEFLDEMPENAVLGATIETNRDELARRFSRAPPPSERYRAMRGLRWPLKHLSIEPILDFDLQVLRDWVIEIGALTVHVGYDNYGHRLPEPPLGKTLKLIDELRGHAIVLRGSLRPAWYESLDRFLEKS